MRGKGGGSVYGQQQGGLFKRGGVTAAAKKKLPSRPAQLPSMRATGHEPFRDDKQAGRWGRPNSLTPPNSASRAPASPSSADDESSLPPQPMSVPPTASNRALPGGAVWGNKSWSKEQVQVSPEERREEQPQQPPQPQPSQPPLDNMPMQWADDEENMDYSKELPSSWVSREEEPRQPVVSVPPTAAGPPTAVPASMLQREPNEDLAEQMRKTIEKRAKEEEEMRQAKVERLQEKLAAMERGKQATQAEADEVGKKKVEREDFEQRQEELAKRRKAQEALKKEWVKAQVAQRKAAIAEIKRQREKLTAGDGAAVPKRTTQRVTAPVEVKTEKEPEKEKEKEEEERYPRANGKGRHYEHDREEYWDRKGGEKGRKGGGYDYRRGTGRGGNSHRPSGPRDKPQGGKGGSFRDSNPPAPKPKEN